MLIFGICFRGIKEKRNLKIQSIIRKVYIYTNLHYFHYQSKQKYLTLQQDLFSSYLINARMVTDDQVNVFKQDCMPGLM